MQFYQMSAEIYLLTGVLVTSFLCILGWLLLGQARRKHLRAYAYWLTPLAIAGTLSACGALLQVYCRFFDRRDYLLATVPYLLYLGNIPLHVAAFVRLWKTITSLPADPGFKPYQDRTEQGEGVWPPPPRY